VGKRSIKDLPPAHIGFFRHPSELYSVCSCAPICLRPCPPRRLFLGLPCISHEDVCHYMHFSVLTIPHLLTPGLSATSVHRAVSKFEMPAMSPTMTEGGIASWKKKEGDSFTAGDVLLEIVCPRQFSTRTSMLTYFPVCTGNGQGSYRRRSTRRRDHRQNSCALPARDRNQS
jgi:hypothetical protein